MSASLTVTATAPLRRNARWLLIAMHVPFFAFTLGQAGLGLAFQAPAGHTAAAVALSIVACVIQLRHSLAAAAGVRPSYWQYTLLLIVVIAYAPAPIVGARWATLNWYVLASFAMLLRGPIALLALALSVLVSSVWYVTAAQELSFTLTRSVIWVLAYWEALQLLGAGSLYGATRLVRLMDELSEARADLAELAIGRERLRISRDLHDLLGQSLSAVSLKGDLAIGLLERDDAPHAIAEIESLVAVARSALHDVLDIAHHEPPIALTSEIERASEFLASTGTDTRVDIGVHTMPPAVEELFAWALREGVTNVLRHSSATMCLIRIVRDGGVVRLEILNDGAMPSSLSGNGLSGLAARAATLSGIATGRSLGDGQFRLTVEVPETIA